MLSRFGEVTLAALSDDFKQRLEARNIDASRAAS